MAEHDPKKQLARVRVCLLDTGPIVAALVKSDPGHARVLQFLASYRGSLVTTGPIVAEAMHFMSAGSEGPSRLVAMLVSAGVDIVDTFKYQDLAGCAVLMNKYSDIPMDFADATLVLLAGRTGIPHVLTFDLRGFRVFRYRQTKPFSLVLDQME